MRIHPSAIVEAAAPIGPRTIIDEFVIIRQGARVGRDCHLYPHVTLEPGVRLGDGVTVMPGAYLGKQPKVAGVIARTPMRAGSLKVGDEAVVGANAVIYAGGSIGARCLIGDGVTFRENSSIGDDSVLGSNSTVQNGAKIGERVKIVDLSHITFDCEIGDESFISVGVYTMNDNSMQRGGEVVGPKIGKRVRIGGGALLLPGVRIGDDAVIAAGAVVTHDVPVGETVMGVPARSRREQVSSPKSFEKQFLEFDGWPPRPYPTWPPEE